MKKNKNTLILVGGYPGTGKTYFSKKIIKKIKCVYLDKDFIQDIFTTKKRTTKAKEVKKKVYSIVYKIAVENLVLGNTVLIDAPFNLEKYIYNKEWVKTISDIAEKSNSRIKLIWCISTSETRKIRLENRNAERDKEIFSFLDDFLALDKYLPTTHDFKFPFDNLIFDTEEDSLNKIWDFLEK